MADQGHVVRRRVLRRSLELVLDEFDNEETIALINGLQKQSRAHDAFPTKPVLFMRLIPLLFRFVSSVQPQQFVLLDRHRTLALHCARVKTSRPWVSRANIIHIPRLMVKSRMFSLSALSSNQATLEDVPNSSLINPSLSRQQMK